MKCNLCGKKTGMIQLIENLGSCNKCSRRKPYHPDFGDGFALGTLIGFTVWYVLLRMGLL